MQPMSSSPGMSVPQLLIGFFSSLQKHTVNTRWMDEYSSEENWTGLKYAIRNAGTDYRGGTKELKQFQNTILRWGAQTLGALTRPPLVWRRWVPGEEEETATFRRSIQLIAVQFNWLILRYGWFLVRRIPCASVGKWWNDQKRCWTSDATRA